MNYNNINKDVYKTIILSLIRNIAFNYMIKDVEINYFNIQESNIVFSLLVSYNKKHDLEIQNYIVKKKTIKDYIIRLRAIKLKGITNEL